MWVQSSDVARSRLDSERPFETRAAAISPAFSGNRRLGEKRLGQSTTSIFPLVHLSRLSERYSDWNRVPVNFVDSCIYSL